MNDRLAFCDVCEDAYHEGAESEHEHPEERAAERRFLGIEQKGPPTGEWTNGLTYTRKDAIRDGRPMRFLSKGQMHSTNKA